jgi:putative ABC transport system permease protein
MDILPIVSTLRRHKTAATLIVVEIALTCAIVCNAVFLIRERTARMDRPSGCADDELGYIQLTGIGTKADAITLTAQDVAALRAIPSVKQVSPTNMVPFGSSSWNDNVSPIKDDPNGTNATMYMGQDLLETLGVRMIAGRPFTPDEYIEFDALKAKLGAHGTGSLASVILTRSLADHLFPAGDALGKPLYVIGDQPLTVVGISDNLLRPNDFGRPADAYYSMIVPLRIPYTEGGGYILRVDPARRDAILAEAEATLNRVDPARIILKRVALTDLRSQYYSKDRSMAWLLVGTSIALLVITALGIVGLASFWVQQRTRQIGIRRALGATRGDIVRYFQTENLVLATLGITIGMALAYALNLWLMQKYQVTRLPGMFLPVGALSLWGLGQLAVLGPALRASAIPPAQATRSV